MPTWCGDDQRGRACFLGKLCWFFVSVEASVFVVDLCALCPLLGVYFGTGGMDLSRVNTTAFFLPFTPGEDGTTGEWGVVSVCA